jgi:hypothetical protein
MSAPQRSQIVFSLVAAGGLVKAETIGVMMGFVARTDTGAL